MCAISCGLPESYRVTSLLRPVTNRRLAAAAMPRPGKRWPQHPDQIGTCFVALEAPQNPCRAAGRLRCDPRPHFVQIWYGSCTKIALSSCLVASLSAHRTVVDEQTLGKLLEAAFVIQEHGAELQKSGRKPDAEPAQDREKKTKSEAPANQVSASPVSASQASSVSGKNLSDKSLVAGPGGKDAYTLTLAQIVETRQQILTRHLELENAMALVAQRTAEIIRASGSAIGIIESNGGKKLQYRAVSGRLTLTGGSEVAIEKALCFACLRSGEIIRCADVNSGLLLDSEECRRRGIGSLIAVPIYRDSGIAGALEVYFAAASGFTEQEVHSCQLMAGLVTEALAREAGLSSRKSLAAERATMLEALEKLRPNLAALMERPPRPRCPRQAWPRLPPRRRFLPPLLSRWTFCWRRLRNKILHRPFSAASVDINWWEKKCSAENAVLRARANMSLQPCKASWPRCGICSRPTRAPRPVPQTAGCGQRCSEKHKASPLKYNRGRPFCPNCRIRLETRSQSRSWRLKRN
jgi:GAF domain-containing protein